MMCIAFFSVAVIAQKKTPPPPPPPLPPPVVEIVQFSPPVIVNNEELDAFLKKNPSVQKITWKNDHIITLKMKDKTIKTYNFWNEKARKSFTKKLSP